MKGWEMQSSLCENKTQYTGFTQVPNDILNSSELSLGAKGLWAYMAGKPEGWKFTIRLIASQCKESQRSITTKLNELIESGYLERHEKMTQNGKQVFYSIFACQRFANLRNANLQNATLEYSNKELSKKDLSKKEPLTKERKVKKKESPFEKVFNSKEVSTELKSTFEEFIESRKLNGKKMTPRALELAIEKVRRLSEDEQTQIAIVNQSIENCWQGLFPLKGWEKDTQTSYVKQPARVPDSDQPYEQEPGDTLEWSEMFGVWEDVLGIRPVENNGNVRAMKVLLRDVGREKVVAMIMGLGMRKYHNYLTKEILGVADPQGLLKNRQQVWSFTASHWEEWQRREENARLGKKSYEL